MKKLIVFALALALMVGAGSFFMQSLGSGRLGTLPFFQHPMPMRGMNFHATGEITEVTRSLGKFDTLVVSGPGTVRIRRGSEASIRIKTNKDMLDKIDTSIKGPALVLGGFGVNIPSNIQYDLVVPTLNAISIAGSGDVIVQDELTGTDLRIDIGGSGSVELGVTIGKLSVNIAGSGDIKVNGKADKIDVKMVGSGDLNASDLNGKQGVIAILGSGDVNVGTYESIDAMIAGSGNVTYRGSPRIKSATPGSGRLLSR
ncbi:head GIN domain-containing protein [Treponema sp.]